MKRLIIYSILTLVLFARVSFVHAMDDNRWIEKKKVITRTISLSDKQKLSIINSFGSVNIKNGNKNEAWVEITIKASSADEKMAQTIFDQIWIDEKDKGGTVSFETKIGGNNSKSRAGRNNKTDSKMEINYEVIVPQNFPLYVKNSFGDTFIPDRNGSTKLQQSFGDLTTENLSRLADVTVEFGKFAATKVNGSRVKASYSDVNIQSLAGDLKANFEFCKKLKLSLSKDLQALNIKTSYSDLQLTVPESFSGNFRINTSFGKAQSGSFVKLTDQTKEEKYSPTFDRSYTGQTGNGKTVILINSSFGNVRIN